MWQRAEGTGRHPWIQNANARRVRIAQQYDFVYTVADFEADDHLIVWWQECGRIP